MRRNRVCCGLGLWLALQPLWSCNGEPSEADASSGVLACQHFFAQVRDCNLLDDGPVDCSRFTRVVPPDSVQEFLCELDCGAAQGCDVLQAALCTDETTFGGDAAQLTTCAQECIDQFGFTCEADGSPISHSWVCDGEFDCADRSDESGCDFVCGDGQAIPKGYVCDGFADCNGGGDEGADCPTFDCGDGTTAPDSYRCDGENDCANGRDEASCPVQAQLICPAG